MNTKQEGIIEKIKNILITANDTPFKKRNGKVIILNFYEFEYLIKLIFELTKC